MVDPNQYSSEKSNEYTGWDELSEVEFSPISVPTDEVSKIELSDDPMGEGRQDKRVDVADASGMEKRTSNLMLGYNERGVQIGETYLSVEEFRERALESLEQDTDDKVLYFVRTTDGKRFAEPREVVDAMLVDIAGVGPEATLSDNANITNQDARSVEFSGSNGETQRGAFMLGNEGIQMPNGTYAEAGTIGAAIGNYVKATKKEAPIPPEPIPEISEPIPETPELTPEPISRTPETEGSPNKDLRQATLDLAELYAKNRRLIPGAGTKEKFENAKQDYQKLLVEHLSKFGRAEYGAGFDSLSSNMETTTNTLAVENVRALEEFSVGKTPEEIEAKREELRQAAVSKMKEQYSGEVANFETVVTSKVVEEYAKARAELEEATVDALDNGTACRQAVSKIIANKWVKRGLAAAAAAGLAVAAVGIGHGVVDGSLAVSVGYTAGGVAAGVARGALSGVLMSRQSSETSAIRGYGEGVAESVKKRMESGGNVTVEGLASEAMSEYVANNQADARSNKVKTAVSTGIGGVVGGAMSGIHINSVARDTVMERVQTGTTTEQVQVGTTPDQGYDVDLSKIDIHEGSGMGETFADLGGDPNKLAEAVKIAQQFDANHGMVPGSNGAVSGVGGQVGNFAHTYPGAIDTWPKQAREYITQVAQKWAENGLIDAAKIGGEPIFEAVETPIFSMMEKEVISYLPNTFYNALVQAEAMAISGAAGGNI